MVELSSCTIQVHVIKILESINGGTLTEEKTDRVRNSKTKTILTWNLTHTAEYNPSFLNYVF